jgi:hypothetical protein
VTLSYSSFYIKISFKFKFILSLKEDFLELASYSIMALNLKSNFFFVLTKPSRYFSWSSAIDICISGVVFNFVFFYLIVPSIFTSFFYILFAFFSKKDD